MDNDDQNTQVASSSAAGGTIRRLQPGHQSGALTIINTDFGGDCDDQKAISQHIAALGKHDQAFFIVSGPYPKRAAESIAQAYHAKKGEYPVVALGRQFEKEKVPEEKIFSLINGNSMVSQEVKGFEPVTLEEFHSRVDAAIKGGECAVLKQCAIGPLHSQEEYYDPASRLVSDSDLGLKWQKLPKFAAVQFQRKADDAGGFKYGGNNVQKSKKDVSKAFTEMLAGQGYTTTYFDGAVAKRSEFLLSARQAQLPGIEKAVAAYMENLQVPWANMPGKTGTTPEAQQMHVGMFTSKGEVPFGVHVLGAIPSGFGIERLAKEVCGVSRDDEKFAGLASKIGDELERFDKQVLAQLHESHPEQADLDLTGMRTVMHDAMLGALNDFARENGVKDTSLKSFRELANAAKNNPAVKIESFKYMGEFKKILFAREPLVEVITKIAQDQSGRRAADGKSHLNRMTDILSEYHATAVGYDAVTFAAANLLERNSELSAHFKEGENAHNVTPSKVDDLHKSNEKLYREFVGGIREEMTLDGGAMANEWSKDPIGVAKAPHSSAVPAHVRPEDIRETRKAPEISSESSRKRGRSPDEESIADRVAQRRRRDPENERIAARATENRRGGRGDDIGL